jgi:hypothetical protein
MIKEDVMMKKFILFLLFCSNVFGAQLVLISDIDDTIKITGVKDPRVINYAGREVEFFGMSSLYNHFLCQQGPDDCLSTGGRGVFDKNVVYVTGQPGALHKLGDKFLRKNTYPYPQNILWKDSRQSTLDFKKEIIEKYIKMSPPNNKYILVGDNGEYDPKVYEYIKNKYSDRVLATFIHMIYLPAGEKHKLLPGQVAYLTSVDLAVHFFNMKQIKGDDLQKIIDAGNKELSNKDHNLLKPWFACKYFRHMNWFPSIQGQSASLELFKKALFESKKCQ